MIDSVIYYQTNDSDLYDKLMVLWFKLGNRPNSSGDTGRSYLTLWNRLPIKMVSLTWITNKVSWKVTNPIFFTGTSSALTCQSKGNNSGVSDHTDGKSI